MKKWLKRIGIGFGILIGLIVVVLMVARFRAHAAYDKTWDIPDHDIPIPFPLSKDEIDSLRAENAAQAKAAIPTDAPADAPDAPGDEADEATDATPEPPADPLAGVDLDKLALERAIDRGKHLVVTRLGCQECHGTDFGGMVVMDELPVGALIAPNITEGEGSVTKGYKPADWVRILRHGVGRDRTTSAMPAEDYAQLSDHEISDVVAYVQSFPPVDRTMDPPRMGPVLWVQFGLAGLPFAADAIDHDAERLVEPPTPEPTAAYGKHIAQVCVGCHGPNFSGGKIQIGDPSWPPAANLTPHKTGLEGWTYEDFERIFQEGKKPDGTEVNPAMPWKLMNAMSDLEKRAMFAYFQSLEPVPLGVR